MRVMFRPELTNPLEHPSVDASAACAMRILVECVTECQARGTIAAGDPMPIVLMGWSTAHGVASLLIDGPLGRLYPDVAPEAVAAKVARTLGALLTARSRGKSASP
jgi:hypothetical protein